MKRKLRYIAIDFDGTITTSDYPNIGEIRENAIETLNFLQEEGYVLILWTCRQGEELKEALAFLKENGFVFEHVNKNPKELREIYGNNPRKLGVDLFIDDKAMSRDVDNVVDWLLIKSLARVKWECLSEEEYVDFVKNDTKQ